MNKLSKSLAGLGIAAMNINSPLKDGAIEREKLINEIMALTNNSRDEIIEFSKECSVSLDFIKQTALLGAELDVNDMKEKFIEDVSQSIDVSFSKAIEDFIKIYKENKFQAWCNNYFMWLYNLTYNVMYLPFTIIRVVWDGVRDSWKDIEEEWN